MLHCSRASMRQYDQFFSQRPSDHRNTLVEFPCLGVTARETWAAEPAVTALFQHLRYRPLSLFLFSSIDKVATVARSCFYLLFKFKRITRAAAILAPNMDYALHVTGISPTASIFDGWVAIVAGGDAAFLKREAELARVYERSCG